MPLTFAPCVVIPCYNHGAMMSRVLARLAPLDLPCIIVDDGSDDATRQVLETLAAHHPTLTLIRLTQNAGKGTAVICGLQAAHNAGFTHAVQVDADGQHAIEDIPELLALSSRYPGALISGQPLYDDSIPRARLYGRWVTHIWVWIETLSLQLKDSMCGFRVYPIAPTLSLASRVSLGKRMDFDTEVMVRLYWQGNTSYFVPTRVTYPQDGLSHFDALKDNLRISLMHTRLFFWHVATHPHTIEASPDAALGETAGSQRIMGNAPDADRLAVTGASGFFAVALARHRGLLVDSQHGASCFTKLGCTRT
ncbi:glycosyl transferase/lysophospholipid acyltransferase [Trabulsiella guamensis ATCC 49490]|uniref:Glycosyl transferase/lysophospholipid acyltransferase n=1 Tax=Trabulsiella guamensis ATCC 49490 TaxID=1005994 RepID=A0A084ZPB3_9ENTR|nr:glycosyl transferase/lysophospholipid acyltransferase [Trabulsiella guamensis ATCC 49490]